jgi:sulfide:quinone oxidoreductase
MVQLIQIDARVYVSPQVAEADFAELAARGFRSVVNNRPDGEAPGQLANAEAEARALAEGLEFRHLPVSCMDVTEDDKVAAFGELLAELPGPIVFYCKSGTRCATLWTQVEALRVGADRALAIALKAGFDLEAIRDDIEERAAKIIERAA